MTRLNWSTHEVENQVPELAGYDPYEQDAVLSAAVRRVGSAAQEAALRDYGLRTTAPASLRMAEDAERYPPRLERYDRVGLRSDVVYFHPAWHGLMEMLRTAGLVALPYAEPAPGVWTAYAAGLYLHGQLEAGSLCPTIMTMAAVSVLAQEPDLFKELRDGIYARAYDDRDLPLQEKRAILVGMGMTEKQGGSDLRANTTTARPLGAAQGRGAAYELVGHKWFFSSPMSDAHLVLARTEAGPSCFFVPRWRPDGTRNAVVVERLKDKVGNRSNSSAEVELQGAWGRMVGEEGRGIPTIIGMATLSRLSCVIGSTALMRQAVVQAMHYAQHRCAFGKRLVDQPLMRSVLCDLALESEAATTLMLRLAAAFEHADQPEEQAWCRILMPAAKFWICKRAVELAGEAMEVFGGNGYVETSPMGRLYREAPVNSIWEGSGNVICLDVLRACGREPDSARELLASFAHAADGQPLVQAAVRDLGHELALPPEQLEARARAIVQRLTLVAQACLLLEHSPAYVSQAFIASRFNGESGRVYGVLPADIDQAAILERAWPG